MLVLQCSCPGAPESHPQPTPSKIVLSLNKNKNKQRLNEFNASRIIHAHISILNSWIWQCSFCCWNKKSLKLTLFARAD